MSEWISVRKDGLPDLNGRYWVTIEYPDRRVVEAVNFAKNLSKVDRYAFKGDTGSGWYVYDSEYGHYTINNVIAWQPLPSPYKGE